jgi:hypothetical protein
VGFIVDDNEKGLHGECRRETFVLYDDFGSGFYVELPWDKFAELEHIMANIRQQGQRTGALPPSEKVTVKVKNTPESREEVARLLVTMLGEETALAQSDGELHGAVHDEIERRKKS